jgi:tetratricopeptide (TPR) repeat protein
MSDHASKKLILVAERLAHLLNSEQGVRILRMLARLGYDGMDSTGVPQILHTAPAIPVSKSGRVGIWQLTSTDGESSYVRISTNDIMETSRWSDRSRIELKNGKRRVVLLGESVARGLFYDPWFNPASALETILGTIDETRDVEVIDLARTDCGAGMLMELAASCLQLEPDAMVIFAGNNWNPYLGLDHPSHQLAIADCLYLRQRWGEVMEYAKNRLRLNAVSVVEWIAALAKAYSLPLVIVIPEFNLCDWQTDCIEAINFLPRSEAVRWRRIRGEAEAALRNEQIERATALAKEMIDLDHGAASPSLEILAHCKLKSGERAEARHLFEKARDAVLGFPGFDSPRCFSIVQEVFRTLASKLDIKVVDLPLRFEEYLNGDLPNHTLFLDYCHLTADGIRLAMASVAEHLLPILGASRQSWQELAKVNLNVSDSEHARAHFVAAIHNSHWRQGYDITYLHCRKAVQSNPEIADNMVNFLDYYIRRAPSLLYRSFYKTAWGEGHFYWGPSLVMASHPHRAKILNPLLVGAILESLKQTMPELERHVQKLLLEQYDLGRRDLDILDPIHWRISYNQHVETWRNHFGYYVSFTPESFFWFPCRRGQPLTVTLTYRVQEYSTDPRETIFYVNNHTVATLKASSSWRTETVRIPSEYILNGFNSIVIAWPDVEWTEAREIQRIASALETGSIPLTLPIYGELYTFRISSGSVK